MVIIKKIISFEKELLFKTKACEVTSISLEHHIDKIEEDLISGKFIISGDYKMTEASITREKFKFDVGFDIALDNRFDPKNLVVDIDDFTYTIINDEILKVNIDLYIDGDEIKDDVIVYSKPDDIMLVDNNIKEEKKEEVVRVDNEDVKVDNKLIEEKLEEVSDNITSLENNIIGNIDSNETYATYYVYIVKEDDTIDKIMSNFKVSKEDISMYNTIENINAGDKIIIPSNNEE